MPAEAGQSDSVSPQNGFPSWDSIPLMAEFDRGEYYDSVISIPWMVSFSVGVEFSPRPVLATGEFARESNTSMPSVSAPNMV
jgi:hypothetical protein